MTLSLENKDFESKQTLFLPELWEVVPAATAHYAVDAHSHRGRWRRRPALWISFSHAVLTEPSPVGTMSAAISLNTSEEDMGGFYALILMSVVPLFYLLVRKGERRSLQSMQQSVT